MCAGVGKSGSPRMREITLPPRDCTSRTSARTALTAVGRKAAIRSERGRELIEYERTIREYQDAEMEKPDRDARARAGSGRIREQPGPDGGGRPPGRQGITPPCEGA